MFDDEIEARNSGFQFVIGIDEAGRGPLAGPVVAAAVAIKKKQFFNPIRDSKKISPQQREKAFHEIFQKAYVGIGIINEVVIDQINILQATFLAMSNAVEQLIRRLPPAKRKKKSFHKKICLLIDGNKFKSDLSYPYKTIIRGDESVLSIMCASIVAKVTRDRILNCYDQVFPQYGFKQHKGYPTRKHRQALKKFGPTEIHRRSFKLNHP